MNIPVMHCRGGLQRLAEMNTKFISGPPGTGMSREGRRYQARPNEGNPKYLLGSVHPGALSFPRVFFGHAKKTGSAQPPKAEAESSKTNMPKNQCAK